MLGYFGVFMIQRQCNATWIQLSFANNILVLLLKPSQSRRTNEGELFTFKSMLQLNLMILLCVCILQELRSCVKVEVAVLGSRP